MIKRRGVINDKQKKRKGKRRLERFDLSWILLLFCFDWFLLMWSFCFLRGRSVLRRHVGVRAGFYGISQTVCKLRINKIKNSHLWKTQSVNWKREEEDANFYLTGVGVCCVHINLNPQSLNLLPSPLFSSFSSLSMTFKTKKPLSL
jgi:hypothetical protein